MAGLGFKDFQVGEVLTSSDVDGYLMQQTVMRFADSGARGSALGTATGTAVPLAEGMITYQDDSDLVEVYDGTNWASVSKVMQVVSAPHSSSWSSSSSSFGDVTGFVLTLTPLSTTSRVLLAAFIGEITTSNADSFWQFTANGTAVSAGASGTSRMGIANENIGFTILGEHSPASTTAQEYKLQGRTASGSVSISASYRNLLLAIEVV